MAEYTPISNYNKQFKKDIVNFIVKEIREPYEYYLFEIEYNKLVYTILYFKTIEVYPQK